MKSITLKIAAGAFAKILLAASITGCRGDTPNRRELVAAEDTIKREVVYKDGVYTATGEYGDLPSHIIVTVTLKDGTIIAVKVEPQATDPTSLDLQRRFAEAVSAVVVGKRISEVNVGRLAGSSGTPKGFNDAIAQIKKQAAK